MSKEVGKVYCTDRTYVLCTGVGCSEETFSGVVVKQTDKTSEHVVGLHSNGWTNGIFKECDKDV